jgi:hypothetical protein
LFSPLAIRAAMMGAPTSAVLTDVHDFINQAIDGLVLALFPHQTLAQGREAERLVRAITAASKRMLSAAYLVETGIVMQVRRGDEAARDLDLLLAKLKIDIFPVSGKEPIYRVRLSNIMAADDIRKSLTSAIASLTRLLKPAQLRCFSRATIFPRRTFL